MTLVNNLSTLALIPARKGSKGLKNKNIFPLNGKELIQYTIEAAQNSKFIDEVFISTDSEYIQKNYNNNCIIINRPKKLSSDSASSNSVIKHFISFIDKKYPNKYKNFNIILLQPTSPLRNSSHIDECINFMINQRCKHSVSVTLNDYSPYKSFKVYKNNKLKSLFKEKLSNMRRQDLPKTYKTNGAIYFFTKSDFIKNKGIPSNNGYAYIMKKSESYDIDSIDDIKCVNKILKDKNRK